MYCLLGEAYEIFLLNIAKVRNRWDNKKKSIRKIPMLLQLKMPQAKIYGDNKGDEYKTH